MKKETYNKIGLRIMIFGGLITLMSVWNDINILPIILIVGFSICLLGIAIRSEKVRNKIRDVFYWIKRKIYGVDKVKKEIEEENGGN
jgi:hypothetical protein